MQKYFSLNKITIVGAILSWTIPFFVSVFLIDPNTKLTIINPILFKIIMFILLSLITFYFYKKIKTKYSSLNLFLIKTANTFLIINIILDFIVLITLLKMPFMIWLTTVFSIYVLVFYGLYFLIKKYLN